MSEPVPVRAVVRQRVTRPHEVIETEQVVEFATPTPAPTLGRELPRAEPAPRCDCALCERGWHLDGCGPARKALPAAPPRRRWWWLR